MKFTITIELRDVHKIDDHINLLKGIAGANIKETTILADTISIMKAIREQITGLGEDIQYLKEIVFGEKCEHHSPAIDNGSMYNQCKHPENQEHDPGGPVYNGVCDKTICPKEDA
jgi:hypothetical protein